MAWYQHAGETYVASYTDERSMRREVIVAAKFGWLPQTTAAGRGEVSLTRGLLTIAFTGGFGFLIGTHRGKDKITITYVRNEAWLAKSQIKVLLAEYNQLHTQLILLERQINTREGELDKAIGAVNLLNPRDESALVTSMQPHVLRAINRLHSVRTKFGGLVDAMIISAGQILAAEQYAQSRGARNPPITFVAGASPEELEARADTNVTRLERLSALSALQKDVTEKWRELQRCWSVRTAALSDVGRAEAQLEKARSKLNVRAESELTGVKTSSLRHALDKVGRAVNAKPEGRMLSASGVIERQGAAVARLTAEIGQLEGAVDEAAQRRTEAYKAYGSTHTKVQNEPERQSEGAERLSVDGIAQLERLDALRERGAISAEEFDRAKARIIERL